MQGTARHVQQSAVGGHDQIGVLTFQIVQHDLPGSRRAPLPVEMPTDLGGRLEDGDQIEVSGVWDGDTLDADKVVNLSAADRSKPRLPPADDAPRKPPTRWGTRIAVVGAVVAVLALTAVAVLYFTDFFGTAARPGPMVKPVSATVFSPDGAPDNPQDAKLAIDGNPDTAWSTVTYQDSVPFPKFISGMGLLLHLSEPTALSVVTIDVPSTGTQVQIRSSPSESPAKLSDTTELTPTTTLQPGHNRIEVHGRVKTSSNVLVWISTLGTTNGQSRTQISEITLQAAG
ncbi:hypothetical protein IWGMT90018_15860 [Mycobacterium kiyosense]|nr:hypothetical protein IWGMT90018_15860 [Mycobacterium kiyosense]